MTTKSAFPALYALISPAWERENPRVEELALPKSVEGAKLERQQGWHPVDVGYLRAYISNCPFNLTADPENLPACGLQGTSPLHSGPKKPKPRCTGF